MIPITAPEQPDRPAPGAAPTSDRGGKPQPAPDGGSRDPYQVRAKHLLRARGVWTIPVIVGSIVLVLITVLYIGSVVDPVAHLRGLPVSIVNEDAGASIGPRHVNFGAELQSGLIGSRTVSTLLSLTPQQLPAAEARMSRSGAYAALVIPPNFTASLLSLAGLHLQAAARAGRPTVELLTNQRAGSLGASLASGVVAPAVALASHRIGLELLAADRVKPSPTGATRAVLADAITLSSVEYRPLPPHSALGLSAFYMALLTLMCGFMGGTIINATVDAATGYATTEMGPDGASELCF